MRGRVGVSLTLVCVLCSFLLCGFAVQAEEEANYIVLIGDVSGSVAQADPARYLVDALSLGVGLAPRNAQVALLSVNTDIVFETAFENVGSADGRRSLRRQIDSIAYTGNTNLVAGLRRGIEICPDGGRVILFADISEGGLVPYTTSGEQLLVQECAALSEQVQRNGIVVDLILFQQAPEGSGLTAAMESLATTSGGQALHADSPAALSACVEQLYFGAYSYQIWPVTGVNSASQTQDISISMPADHARRARIYVPTTTGIQAAYAGAGLEVENRKTFSLLDLSRPAQRGITLTLDPSNAPTQIYLITEYALDAVVTTQSESIPPTEKGAQTVQSTVLLLDILDENTANSVLGAETAQTFAVQAQLTGPDGTEQTLALTAQSDGKYSAALEPQVFGTYSISAVLSQGESDFASVSTSFEIADVREPVQPRWTLAMTIAVITGALLILAAILFAKSRRKKEEVYRDAVKPIEVYRFSGRLQIATVIAGGGEKEIRPFTFQLDWVQDEKRLTLAQLYEASGIPCEFAGGDKIIFMPGPGNSIVVKNNSPSKILASGREYGTREKLQLHYDQKIYIVFREHEDELEVYYRPSRHIHSGSTKLSIGMQA